MGRQLPVGYMSRSEVAQELGVNVDTVQRLVKRGILSAHVLRGVSAPAYRRAEVYAAKTEDGGRADFHKVKSVALAALSTARRTESRLAEIYERLGLGLESLSRDEVAVRALYAEVQQPFVPTSVREPGWMRRWGGIFFSMDEHYLELVEHLTDTPEPWLPFFSFAQEVMNHVHTSNEPAVLEAAKYFEASRNHLRYISYMYCRRVFSPRIASTVFDGRATAIDELLAILS